MRANSAKRIRPSSLCKPVAAIERPRGGVRGGARARTPSRYCATSSWSPPRAGRRNGYGKLGEVVASIRELRRPSPQDERRLFWDEEDRLVKTLDSRSETVYAYDASGERVVKRGPYGEAVYVNGYYAVRNGAIESKQIFAGNTRVATKMANKGKDQGTYYYHGDHLASSNSVTTRTGTVHEYLDYFPYGETWVQEKATNAQSMPYKFTAKELDPETNLYYYGARYYDAQLSRWVSADKALKDYLPLKDTFKVQEEDVQLRNGLYKGNAYLPNNDINKYQKLPGMGGVFNSKNLDMYHYVGNNPIILIDPNGLWTFQLGLQATGGIGGGGTAGFGIIFGHSKKDGWQIGTYESVGGGGYSGWSGSVTIEGAWSNNDNINMINGPTGTVGGSVDLGISVGGEVNIPIDSSTKNSYAGSVGLGIGPCPVEGHGFIVNTWVQDKTESIKNLFKKLFD